MTRVASLTVELRDPGVRRDPEMPGKRAQRDNGQWRRAFMRWLRRRVGCKGPGRGLFEHALAGRLPQLRPEAVKGLGLTSTAVRALAQRYAFSRLSRLFPARGTAEDLERVAWWGSALADVACNVSARERARVLTEAALFNLAVAIFDTAVEAGPPTSTDLGDALSPGRMRSRLEDPFPVCRRCFRGDFRVGLVLDLFEGVLGSAAFRLRDQPEWRGQLADLLEAMYESELGIVSDPFPAKTLPVVFIGFLSSEPGECLARSDYFAKLGRFFALWDDWLDLADDMVDLAPNGFLGRPRLRQNWHNPAYFARCALRVVAGPRCHEATAKQLASLLQDVEEAAAGIGPTVLTRTLSLCAVLVG